VAPTITKDNFILVDRHAQTRRIDVGDSEGPRMPFVVQTILEDSGTPCYVKFWYRNYWVNSFSTGFKKPSHQSFTPLSAPFQYSLPEAHAPLSILF
jgi:hypothetical protein